ncbi:OmpA family protein [Echinicola jeungdonensis]|uniref:OmpA family protein n=1 Tax=Echinicola jeungdonensis TaxID=709343 RepID=A0ABV5J7V0_9BACT|nr:OmpA family protein [Echinicola jeungdonensis]MDN3670026.1 OmpA family protein [Echinicola jeungdonensis]
MLKTQFILLLTLISFGVWGQDYSVDDRRAIKLYQEGKELVLKRRYLEAMEKYQATIRRNDNFLEAYRDWSQLLLNREDYENSLQVALRGESKIRQNEEFKDDFGWLLTKIYLKSGNFQKAIEKFKETESYFSEELKASQGYQDIARQLRFIEKEIQNAKSIEKEKLEKPLNNFKLQYFPVLTADSKRIFFTKRDGLARSENEDIFVANWQNGHWTQPEPLSKTINTINNEGTCTISADGKILIYTSCDAPDSFGSCDLYVAYKVNGLWQKPRNMGEKVNSRYWDSQPSLSADGSILFFSSNRRGGCGGNDIWYTMRMDDGTWSEPVNVGEVVNTVYDEVSPFIYFNNELLFFASNGHIGFGGMDLFTTKINKGVFESPQNLGYPINDHKDQLALFITAQRDYAYYTENSLSNGVLDRSFLFRFPFPKEIDLGERLVVTEGKVINERTGKPVEATLSLVNLENDSTMYAFKSDGESGEFMMLYPDKAFSGLYVEKEGYLPKIYNVEKDSLKDIKDMKVSLTPVEKGEQFVFENVFFDFDKADLKKESMSSLVRLKKFMKENPDVDILIEGHTDSVGDDQYNQDLSLRRAQSVKAYLISQGVSGGKLKVKGWGDKKPLVSNDTPSNRAKNRRIEIVIQ